MLYQKTGLTNFDELRITDSSNNESTNSRVTGNQVGRDGSLDVGAQRTP